MKCRHCSSEMTEGKAFAPTLVAGAPDFPGQTDLRGQTLSEGHGKLVIVNKCPSCGHSFMDAKPKPITDDNSTT